MQVLLQMQAYVSMKSKVVFLIHLLKKVLKILMKKMNNKIILFGHLLMNVIEILNFIKLKRNCKYLMKD